MTIRVFLADDQDLVRDGLAMIVSAQDDLVVVGRPATGPRRSTACPVRRPTSC
jgi:DNA-binding NarL/FixJ family response regulator